MNGLTQNIVNNSSFEEVIGCPSASDINYVPPWFANSPSSPDVYNICNWNIPNALPGYQWPNSGVCFVGIWFGTVGTEYFTGILSQELINNKNYCVGFHTNLSNKSEYSIDRIGLKFSSDTIFDSLYYLPYIPDIESPEGIFISDTVLWTIVWGIYKGQGFEKYLTIGNFHHIDSTNKQYLGGGLFNYSYYYIDDVFVYEIDSFLPGFTGTDTVLCDTSSTGITLGDTALYGYHYRWYPPYGLSDTTAAQPIAKPDSATTYYLTVTDTFHYRCRQGEVVARDTVTVTVKNCVGIEELRITNFKLRIEANTGGKTIKITYLLNSNQPAEFTVYDLLGRMMARYELSPSQTVFEADVVFLNNGLYYFSVAPEGGVPVNGKLIILNK